MTPPAAANLSYHGDDSIDLVGDLGDPLYATGAGIFHIGGVSTACSPGVDARGTCVWIDHGPAGSTRYHHLDSITAVEGQLVPPGTQIGTGGHSAAKVPCETNCLHMESAPRRDELTFDGSYRNTGRRTAGTRGEIPIEGRAGIGAADAVIANITVTDASLLAM